MNNESFKLIILQSYARRIRNWLECFGIIFLVICFTFLYQKAGLLAPLEGYFSSESQTWWSVTLFGATVIFTALAVAVGALIEKSFGIKTSRRSGPIDLDDPGIQLIAIEKVLKKIYIIESVLWLFAACPAIVGALLFAMGRPFGTMFLYLGISISIGALFLPSLDRTEELLDQMIEKHKMTAQDGDNP